MLVALGFSVYQISGESCYNDGLSGNLGFSF